MDVGTWGPVRLARRTDGFNLGIAPIGVLTFPPLVLGLTATLRIVSYNVGAGAITMNLRFGFLTTDLFFSTSRIQFTPLAGTNARQTRSMGWGLPGTPPNPGGRAPGFIPPRASVHLVVPGGTVVTWELSATARYVTG